MAKKRSNKHTGVSCVTVMFDIPGHCTSGTTVARTVLHFVVHVSSTDHLSGSSSYKKPNWQVINCCICTSRIWGMLRTANTIGCLCHLDYCNSLLYGIADADLGKVQRVQNRLARVVTKSRPFTHSVPLLRSLRWLAVKFRILFEINLLIYKMLHEKQPVSMLAASLPSRSLEFKQRN